MHNRLPILSAGMEQNRADKNMGWRGSQKNYRWPGTYHITISVLERQQQPLGRIVGDVSKPDGDPLAPKVHLSEIGKMVEHELLHSIHAHYPMIDVEDYVVMPDHLHFIVVVHRDIVSSHGRDTHLGQVIAGFKKGCNRRYWELTGQTAQIWQGQPAVASPSLCSPSASFSLPAVSPPPSASCSLPAVYPQASLASSQPSKIPSDASTGRPPLFSYGYVDVMPLKEGQLERQREYIRNNPRYRLMRQQHPKWLVAQRASVATSLTLPALKGYLQRECGAAQFNTVKWEMLQQRLLTENNAVVCDSYGNSQLLSARLLPVVCHRKDAPLFQQQKARCLAAAASGVILVSARIAKGEQDIINSAIQQGYPVVTVEDNGFPSLYHPSEHRMDLCLANKLLIVTPWLYAYRRVGDTISVAECKAMNCVVQSICRTKDSWWKEEL
jgi:REP element-mobilizing transposase RayT